MLSHCANTDCHKPFLKLREGKLFLVETERLTKPGEPAVPPFVRAKQTARHVEHYWLCGSCAAEWTLVYDKENGVALAPLRRPHHKRGGGGTEWRGLSFAIRNLPFSRFSSPRSPSPAWRA